MHAVFCFPSTSTGEGGFMPTKSKCDCENVINPDVLYTPAALARIFQVDVTWIKRNLFKPGGCRYRKQGSLYFVVGRWLVEWAQEDHETNEQER